MVCMFKPRPYPSNSNSEVSSAPLAIAMSRGFKTKALSSIFLNNNRSIAVLISSKFNGHLSVDPISRYGFRYQQRASLVNSRIKWVKDRVLDCVIEKEKDLKAVCILKDIIRKHPGGCLPIHAVSKRRIQLGLDIRVLSFMRRYPTIFEEFVGQHNGLPWFKLTRQALDVDNEERRVYEEREVESVERLCKLLMITRQKILPLQTIDQLRWDMGLPEDYVQSMVTRYPDYFNIVSLPDQRQGVGLVHWNDGFAVSVLQKKRAASESGTVCSPCKEILNDNNKLLMANKGEPLAFPMNFMRGYGLKRKFAAWLEEWQRLPYISPYEDSSRINPNSDVSEKRVVGVFHELLYLTIQKKTERKNLSNLRKCLGLPQKFTKVFNRHPGIFYLSQKRATVTVMLREAYTGAELIERHPLVGIRDKYISMMRIGMLNRSRGLYKRDYVNRESLEEDELDQGMDEGGDSGDPYYDRDGLSEEMDSIKDDLDDYVSADTEDLIEEENEKLL